MESSYLKDAREYYQSEESRDAIKDGIIRHKLLEKLSEVNKVKKAAKKSYFETFPQEEAE
ncbi:MAG: hypothetical protein LBR16_05590, partial [Treponema sp.]|jgi:hypothetical protein|nr:hypothetical protein [Treponema sp.]